MASLPREAFAEQAEVDRRDRARRWPRSAAIERINYLMLMMVDPHVHFHVIPRYSGSREWGGLEFADQGWPGPPDLKSAVDAFATANQRVTRRDLRTYF